MNKYKSLIGRKFDFTGFSYLYEGWVNPMTLGEERGSSSSIYGKVWRHEICTIPGVLFGQECIWEEGEDHKFYYSITELERTGQLTINDLIQQDYDIY